MPSPKFLQSLGVKRAKAPKPSRPTDPDTLFPAPPTEPAPTRNLTTQELSVSAAAAPFARFREACRQWDVRSIEAGVASDALKVLDERIGRGVAFCDRQAFAVRATKGDPKRQAETVEADRLLAEGQALLGRLRDERHRLQTNLDTLASRMERDAVEMGESEDAVKRALRLDRPSYICSRCYGLVLDGAAHLDECQR